MDKKKIEKARDTLPLQSKDDYYELDKMGCSQEELKEVFDENHLIIGGIRLESRFVYVTLKEGYSLEALINLIDSLHAQGYFMEGDREIGFYFD